MSDTNIYVLRGEARLCNWGNWCAGDTARSLREPNQSPIARLYQPEKGDTYEEDLMPTPLPPNDEEAAAVERQVLAMALMDRLLLYYAYVLKYPVSSARRGVPTLVRRTGLSEEAVNARLARICENVGRLKL